MSHTRACILLSLVMGLVSPPTARGATKVWTGGSGANSNWTTTANWLGVIGPVAGADLIFQEGAARKVNTIDFVGLDVGSLIFTGAGYRVPATIQLQSAGKACFETTVVTPRKNTASVLKANGG